MLIVKSDLINLESDPLSWLGLNEKNLDVVLCDSHELSRKAAAKLFSTLQGGLDIRYDFKSLESICGHTRQPILVMTSETADRCITKTIN